MLSKVAIEKALVISNNAMARGLSLGSVEGSPVALVSAPISTADSDLFKDDPVHELTRASRDGKFNVFSHSAESSKIAETLTTIIEARMRIVREEIFPLIRNIVTVAKERQFQIASDNPLNVSVEFRSYPEIYSTMYVENALSMFQSRVPNTDRIPEALTSKLVTDINASELTEMLTTSNDKVNDLLRNCIEATQEEEKTGPAMESSSRVRSDLANNLFRGRSRVFGEALYSNQDSLLTFLFIKAVLGNKHPYIKVEDLSSQERIELTRSQQFYAGLVIDIINLLERDSASGNIFFSISEDRRTVIARDKQYLKWIEGAGSLEAVIGAVSAGVSIVGLDSAARNGDLSKYELDYKRRLSIHESKIAQLGENELESLTRREIINHLVNMAKDNERRELALDDEIKQVRSYVKENRVFPGASHEAYIAQVVCRTIGRNLDAEVTYNAMDEYLKDPENEGKTMNDAACVAYARLLGRFLGCQITSDKVAKGFNAVMPSV